METSWKEKAIQAIEQQQKGVQERSAPWMVGEQLKDICRREPKSAELIAQDLETPAMGITQAEQKIKAFADGHRTGQFACVTPMEADRILREFYGLPALDEPGDRPEKTAGPAAKVALNLADFL
jgi:hypothetical protein